MAFQNTSEDRNGRPKYGDEKLKFKFVWPIKVTTYKNLRLTVNRNPTV